MLRQKQRSAAYEKLTSSGPDYSDMIRLMVVGIYPDLDGIDEWSDIFVTRLVDDDEAYKEFKYFVLAYSEPASLSELNRRLVNSLIELNKVLRK